MAEREPGRDGGDGGGEVVGSAAIRYTAYVVITLAVLYFIARFVMPLFWR